MANHAGCSFGNGAEDGSMTTKQEKTLEELKTRRESCHRTEDAAWNNRGCGGVSVEVYQFARDRAAAAHTAYRTALDAANRKDPSDETDETE